MNYTPARQWLPELPLWIDGAIEKAVHKNTERRYSELSEFIHDLANPNDEFLRERHEPLLTRNPLAFWRGLTILSVIINLILIAKIFW